MLTGLLPPTSGEASIFGASINGELDEIRQTLGVCPQHDVLWPDLTVREHLLFFAGLKGVPNAEVPTSVAKLLSSVGLSEKVDALTTQLSGGQKRKLSVCIALIGGERTKVCVFDEPTSGMDPYSRRATWEVLQNAREGRIMVLTTHYLDEADLLGDRIAIMADGELEVAGSSMFLKQKYGVGYVLAFVKGATCDVASIGETVGRYLVAGGFPPPPVLSNVGTELCLQLPLSASSTFPALFAELESRQAALGFVSYGISVTSLEDVFLKIAHRKEEVGKGAVPVKLGSASLLDGESVKTGSSYGAMSTFEGGASPAAPLPPLTGVAEFVAHFFALFLKRVRYARRDWKALTMTILVPLVVLAGGLYMLRSALANGQGSAFPSVSLTWKQYNLKVAGGGVNPVPYVSTPGAEVIVDWAKGAGSGPNGPFPGSGANGGASFVTIPAADLAPPSAYVANNPDCNDSSWDSTIGLPAAQLIPTTPSDGSGLGGVNGSATVWAMSNWLLANSNPASEEGASRYGAFAVPYWDGWNASWLLLANSTGFHAVPTMLAMLDSALLNGLTKGALNASITVTNAPLPFTRTQLDFVASVSSFIAVLFVSISFSFVPAAQIQYVVREREVGAKAAQLAVGVSVPAYWVSNWVFEMMAYVVPCVGALIMLNAFNVSELVGSAMTATTLLFIVFGTAVCSFSYLLSFAFRSHSSAQTYALLINLLCLVLLIASFVMGQLASTCVSDGVLRWFYRLLPAYALGSGLMQLSLIKQLPVLQNTCTGNIAGLFRTYEPFDMEVAGAPLIYLAVETVVYLLIAILLDMALSNPALRARLLPDKDAPPAPQYTVDDDVAAEAARVDSGDGDYSIIVKHLRKVFRWGGSVKVAVEDVSLAIPRGEVFGFLGVNGAGKTTTLGMLAGQLVPTRGGGTLLGHDIATEQKQLRRLLGMCPQHDALLDLLTVREHLELYASIKGLHGAARETEVVAGMANLDLTQYERKLAHALSGGSKRRLSMAVALVGNPPLLIADEPSSGVDPAARRFMWDVLARTAAVHGTSILLTSHSMEEVEALSSRIGIMVGGRLRCLGSPQVRGGGGGWLRSALRPRATESLTPHPHPSAALEKQVWAWVPGDGQAGRARTQRPRPGAPAVPADALSQWRAAAPVRPLPRRGRAGPPRDNRGRRPHPLRQRVGHHLRRQPGRGAARIQVCGVGGG